MPFKLVLNIERVGARKLRAQVRHDTRAGTPGKHIDPSRTHLNQVLAGTGNAVEDVASVLESHQAKIKADNEAPFTRFVVSASPDHFKGPAGDLDPQRVAEFSKGAMKWLREEYGDGLAYAVLHLDERTPHIHAVGVPLYEKQTKRGTSWAVSHHQHEATKGKGSYEAMRHRAAAALGLDYGEPGNKPRTEEVRKAQEAAAMTLDLAHAQRTKIISGAKQEAGQIVSKAKAKASAAMKEIEAVRSDDRFLWDHAVAGIQMKREALAKEKADLEARERQLAQDAAVVAAARRAHQLPPVPELEALAARSRRARPTPGPR